MAGRGRPTKFTTKVRKKILEGLRHGYPKDLAFKVSGINRSNAYEWLRRGAEEEEGPYKDFRDEVQRAIADSEAALADVVIQDAIKNRNPRSAMQMLKARFSKNWNTQYKMEVTGKDGGPIQTQEIPGSAVKKIIEGREQILEDALNEVEKTMAVAPAKASNGKNGRKNGKRKK